MVSVVQSLDYGELFSRLLLIWELFSLLLLDWLSFHVFRNESEWSS